MKKYIADSFVKTNGTSSQFLKANGDIDSTSYLPLTGGILSGMITFQTSAVNNGFRWDVNSDAAGITFKNTGDGDSNSYFNFFTEDNGNEYFKFSHNTWNLGSFDWMDVKDSVVRVNGNIYVNASQSGSRSAGTNELVGGNLVWHSGNLTNLNQLTTRNFSDLQNKPTTLSGYGITDTPWTSCLPLSGGLMSGTIYSNAPESYRLINDNGFIPWYNSAGTVRTGYLQLNAASASALMVEVNQDLMFGTNSIERLRIYAGGNATFFGNVTAPNFNGLASNASLFNGRDLDKFIHGNSTSGQSGAPTTWSSSHYTQWHSGFWDINGVDWTPDTNWYWGITASHRSNDPSYNYSGQQIYALDGSESYFRTIAGGVQQPWKKIWHNGNLTELSQLSNDVGYLTSAAPVSGSVNYIQNQNSSAQSANMWISGSANFNGGVVINNGSSDNMLTIGNGFNDPRITLLAGGGVNFTAFRAGGDNRLYLANDKASISPTDGLAVFTGTVMANGLALTNPFGQNNSIYSNPANGNANLFIKGGNYTHSVHFQDSYTNNDYATLFGGYDLESSFTLNRYNSINVLMSQSSYRSDGATIGGGVSIGINNLDGKLFRVNGTSRFDGDITLDYSKAIYGSSNEQQKIFQWARSDNTGISTFSYSGFGQFVSNSIINAPRFNGQNSSDWFGGVFGGNGGSDKVVIGNLGGYGATIGAHNGELNAWSTLRIQPIGNETIFGGNVTAPTFIGTLTGNASTSTSSTKFMSTSHAGTFWLENNWNGTYWMVTSNHGAGVRVMSSETSYKLDTARNINGVPFDGTSNISVRNVIPYSDSPITVETGRNSYSSGVYTYNVNNNSLGGSTPTQYWSILDWGNGAGGSVQIASSWTGNTGNLWFRSLRDTADDWYDWKEILHNNNIGNYALPINGGQLSTNGYIDFLNGAWGEKLRVGGNGHTSNLNASVVTTDGNLHLDSKIGKRMYFNYYSGSGFIFGGGNANIVASMEADGQLWKGTNYATGDKYVYNSGSWNITSANSTKWNNAIYNGDTTRFGGDANTLGLNGTSGIYNVSGPSNTVSSYGTLYAFFNTDISTQLHLSYNGDAYWRKSNGSTYTGSVWRTFLDSSNYNSYTPTLTGTASGLNIGGNAATSTRANGNFYIDNSWSNSLVGLYDSTKYQGIYAMGDSFKLSADAASPGNLYGLAWTHTNVGGQSKSGLGHQMLVMENGVTQTAIGNGIWTRADITAVGTIYGNGGGLTGTANGLSIGGNAATATSSNRLIFNDGPRNLSDRLPNSFARTVNFDFVNASIVSGSGSYGGVMTFSPWEGNTASTGDSSYQLGFANRTGVNASGIPDLKIRNGIDTTWNSWHTLLHSANYNSYSPSLTGTGASGTWGINISGNAATVSNGVYISGNQFIADTKTFYSNNNSGEYNTRAIELREVGLSGTTNVTSQKAPSIGFHWSGVNQCQLAMMPDGQLVYRQDTNSGFPLLHSANYNSYSPSLTGTGASGIWGINVTGNAATVTNGFYRTNPGSLDVNANLGTALYAGSTELWTNQPAHGHNGNALLNIETHPGNYISQLWFDTGGNSMKYRNINAGSAGNWLTMLHSENIGNYSPSLTGTGASGTWGINITGNASSSSIAANTVTGTGEINLVYANMADNDQFRIRVGGTASNAGWAEIATADDGNEPIYVRQYTGVFATVTRTATLLDASGNTSFPGDLTVNSKVSIGSGSAMPAGSGFWTGYTTNGRVSLGALNTNNGYGMFYYQGTAGRDGVDSIDLAFNSTTSASSMHSFKSNGDYKLAGTLSAVGDVIAYSSSDRRLKDNIKPIENAMDKIAKIGGYEFDWNDNQDTYTGHDIGVIAQEVEGVLPELVVTRENGYKAVKYEKMIALLIQGMKEQQLEIDELKRIINNK